MTAPVYLDDLLARACGLWPQARAVRDVGEASEGWDFEDLGRRVAELAAGLERIGAGAGDRIAVLAKNRADTVALYFAAARLGAVLVPLNYRLSAPELEWILRHCPPRVLCVEPAFAATVEGVASELVPAAGRLIWDLDRPSWQRFEGLGERAAAPLVHPGARSAEQPNPAQPVVQMYTSGTTGRPKGALLSHANVLSLTEAWVPDMHLAPERSRFLQVTPLFHVGGMLMVMSTVAQGAELQLLPEFDPAAAIDALVGAGITHTLMVPAMIQWCLLDPHLRGKRFPDLELMVYGAAPMPVPLLTQALETFDCALLQGYGLTESAGVLLVLRPEDHRWDAGQESPDRLASAGRAVPCSEVRVVDENGNEVERGEVGEIVARGPNLTLGYYRDEQASLEAFRGGWFHTGDLARVDADGYVYVVDRIKDMILVGGENVYPREIEEVLMAQPAVADAGVIGIPHDVWGEQVHALVVLREGIAFPGERALIRACRQSLASFKCPSRIELRDNLGRNAAGKLQKAALRDPYWSGRPRRV